MELNSEFIYNIKISIIVLALEDLTINIFVKIGDFYKITISLIYTLSIKHINDNCSNN